MNFFLSRFHYKLKLYILLSICTKPTSNSVTDIDVDNNDRNHSNWLIFEATTASSFSLLCRQSLATFSSFNWMNLSRISTPRSTSSCSVIPVSLLNSSTPKFKKYFASILTVLSIVAYFIRFPTLGLPETRTMYALICSQSCLMLSFWPKSAILIKTSFALLVIPVWPL